MQLFDPNNPNEKKKMIAAGVLGVGALLVLGYVFFGGSSPKPATPRPTAGGPTSSPRPGATPPDGPSEDQSIYSTVVYNPGVPKISEANRNIFAYFEPTPTPLPYVPTPTPVPTPPLVASSLNPSSVYARTPADFSLQVMGDRFTPGLHITIDGRDMPTRFINAQQLFTTVPLTMIATPGVRQVSVRSNDGKIYSNDVALNVSPAPTPNFSFIGMIGKRGSNDTAVLQDKGSKELQNVQRGDVLNGKFRVTSISEKEVVLIDTTLKIRHPIPFSTEGAGSQFRPPVRTTDDEPL